MVRNVHEMLDEVTGAPVEAHWVNMLNDEVRTPLNDAHSVVDLSLPQGCTFDAAFINNGGKYVSSGFLFVKHELRGHGIGERLVRSLASLSVKYGFATMRAQIRSEFALDIDRKVYSEDRLDYLSVNHGLMRWRVPKTYSQARKRLVRFSHRDPGSSLRHWGIDMRIDLTNLDTSGWEQPIEHF